MKRITQLHPSFLVVSQYYDPRVPEAEMYKGLKQELAAFKKRVPRVILIEDPPRHPDIDPVDCLLRSGATLGDCTLTLPSDLVAEHTKIRDILLSYAGDRYLSTRRWFCYGGKCPVVIGRTIAFRDTNHITESYGRQIAPADLHVSESPRPRLIRPAAKPPFRAV